MKSHRSPIFALIALLLMSHADLRAQLLTTFGSSATNGGGWNYDPNTSTISGADNSGYLIFGSPVNTDLGSHRYLSLSGNATAAPSFIFTITLEDNASHLATAQFKWADFSGGATSIQPLNYGDDFNFSNIVGWSLDAGGSTQTVNASFTQLLAVAAIPEPSVTALGVLSLGVAGVYFLRRNRSQAPARVRS